MPISLLSYSQPISLDQDQVYDKIKIDCCIRPQFHHSVRGLDTHFPAKTILEYICENEQNTTLGVELLLNHHQIKVNKGYYSPMYLALRNVESEED